MDEETGKKTEEKNEEKITPKKNTVNGVILVQTLVCAFVIFLIVLTGKLSPETFEILRKEYNEIMKTDMSAQEVADSFVSAAKTVTEFKAAAAEPVGESEEKSGEVVDVMAKVGESGEITVPVHGRISSEYGYRTNPISGAYALHTGLDIAAEEGTCIVAAYDGVVKDTGTGTKRGKYVLMKHADGSETLYCHCSKILVDEDEVIMAGEPLALVGETGWATGPHLHFEIHRNGTSVDPLTVLSEKDGRV